MSTLAFSEDDRIIVTFCHIVLVALPSLSLEMRSLQVTQILASS
jgi:hypothetical protein